jgi:hypothetical protein
MTGSLAFWNYALSSPDVTSIESYITSRWGTF